MRNSVPSDAIPAWSGAERAATLARTVRPALPVIAIIFAAELFVMGAFEAVVRGLPAWAETIIDGVILATVVGLAMVWAVRREAHSLGTPPTVARLGGLLGAAGALVAEIVLHELVRSVEGMLGPAGATVLNAALLSAVCAPICLWVLWLARRGALHDGPATVDFVSPHPTMRLAMLATLAFIALIFFISQVGALYADIARTSDAEAISQASRQRMMSQRIGRLAFGLAQASETRVEGQAARLAAALEQLQDEAVQLHARIVADSANHRGSVHPAYAALEKAAVERAALIEAGTALLRTTAIVQGPPPAFAVDRLQAAIDRFLPHMESAVASLGAHADRSVADRIARTTVHLLAMPLLLMLAAFGIVLPIARMVARQHTANMMFMGDLEMNKSLLEQQASDSIALAEDLALNQAELEASRRQADHIANHDHLTGLPNRRAFQTEMKARLARAAERGLPVALLFVDLDKFKTVNDTLGHDAGDELLRTVTARLRGALREQDFAARIGGDEFAVITNPTAGLTHEIAVRIAERIRGRLQIPVETSGGAIPVGATIGVALYPHDGVDAAALTVAADHVMYEGKRRGRNRVVSAADPELRASAPVPAPATGGWSDVSV